MVAVDDRTLACLQDEQGVLWFVDVLGERPTRSVPFGEPGDYEGLARVGETFWALRSNGRLLHLVPARGSFDIAAAHRLPRDHVDWEGLCFDPDRGLLLAVPKDRPEGDRDERGERRVYAIDPATGATLARPVLEFSMAAMLEDALVRDLPVPVRMTPKGKVKPDLKLLFSEVLAIPGSKDLLLLSGVDRALLRVAPDGRLVALRTFAASELPQPEAMTFLPDGRLLVASEARDGDGDAVIRVVECPAGR